MEPLLASIGQYMFHIFGLMAVGGALALVFSKNAIHSIVGFLLFTFIWVRATIPRYRYDQIMAIAWKYLIPFTLVDLVLAAAIRFTMP